MRPKCRSVSTNMSSTSTDTMGVTNLNNTVSLLWDNALSERTLSTYSAGVNSFKTFLLLNNISSDVRKLPEVTEDVFILYIAYSFDTLQIKHSSIKLYLSGIRFGNLKTGTNCPLLNSGQATSARIHAFLNAVKRIQGHTKRPRHPITASVLNQMCSILQNVNIYRQLTRSCIYHKFLWISVDFCSEITTSQHHSMDLIKPLMFV